MTTSEPSGGGEIGADADNGPDGELAIRTLAMPADTNPSGDIFGGWLLSQMDIAGGETAAKRAGGRTVTVGIQAMTFHLPVYVGDMVGFYADIVRIGRTSISVRVEAWAERRGTLERVRVTEGVFTYVAMGDDGKPRVIGDG